MTRALTFLLTLLAVFLYFSLIVFLLRLLQSAKSYQRNNLKNHNGIREHKPNLDWCKGLQYRSPSSSNVVALVSYPGSGTTWLRYLLQQVTGIVTGSTVDSDHSTHGFPAQNVINGSVIVVNTHELPTLHSFKSAIILIRKPSDAILAEYNRLHEDNVGIAPKSAFKCSYTNIDWSIYVINQTSAWETFYRLWLEKFTGPIHIVFYEILVADTRRTLKGILNFLNYTVTEEDMNCALAKSEEIFERDQREKKYQDFEPFSADMYTAINKVRYRVLLLVTQFKTKRN